MRAQLLLAQGASFEEAGLGGIAQDPLQPPNQHSIQFRITAEDPGKNYSLSIGKLQSFHFPSGNGVRVDTALVSGAPAVIGSDFDSVIAKLIVTGRKWQDVVRKARRALEDTSIKGIKTNLALLRAIAAHPDFEAGACDTQWLETKHGELIERSRAYATDRDPFHGLVAMQTPKSTAVAASSGAVMFRKDDAWAVTLRPNGSTSQTQQPPHHFQLTKVLRNDFPTTFAAEILFTAPGSQSQACKMDMQSTSASASAASSQHRQGSHSDPSHVVLPISGKLVDVMVDVGDMIQKDDPICVIKQMKMEIEIRSHKSGLVSWVTEAADDEDVAEGMLAAVIADEKIEAKL